MMGRRDKVTPPALNMAILDIDVKFLGKIVPYFIVIRKIMGKEISL